MRSLSRTFKVEVEVEASYDVEKYEYGADADGRRGEIRYEVQNVRIETPVGDILKEMLIQIEAQAQDA